ncbi:hypothetical protein XNC1_4543 [Xenorhabdus nematophila ATCC 19061]|uniref:Uncharacterized protein n=1 Tax=Xenorhabdus nematophila (strain ATCC 19061 / DSM 3370 / CCUG 14189 / LMG 1036 / NCIMB 9965 / AN6) TaxID=406817 RepID=D3VFA8_XENNA|nr:hypothetical protein XNC1_4543 [Xenorhabdus nematophila ATCC 19061]
MLGFRQVVAFQPVLIDVKQENQQGIKTRAMADLHEMANQLSYSVIFQ